MLTDDERRQLLAIAREHIACALANKPVPDCGRTYGRLAEPGGAFVTIRMRDRLRGCIGYIESPLPLAKVVAEVAVKSALHDPRFSPLSAEEFEGASLEVSILSPLQPMKDTGDIRIGVHGLLVERDGRRGLLLPQVALEYGWDVPGFLGNTCKKAGLREGAWKDPGTNVLMFTAEVCNESQPHA